MATRMQGEMQVSQSGVTLVEAVIVIAITGIVAATVAVFIRSPIQAYFDTARRSGLTDIADTALRRMGRDINTAVPNSVRLPVATGSQYIEFLPTTAGGRYRADTGSTSNFCGAAGDDLSFTAADTCFEIIGPALPFTRGANDDLSDQIIVGSTQSDGNSPYDKTAAGVRRPYTGATATLGYVTFLGVQFPSFAQLDGHRFTVVPADQQAVTYSCESVGVGSNGTGTGTLRRYSNYGFNVAQQAPPLSGASAILADKLGACSIDYRLINQNHGLVSVSLAVTEGGETVSLQHQISVNNTP